jgi:hypothetical protein
VLLDELLDHGGDQRDPVLAGSGLSQDGHLHQLTPISDEAILANDRTKLEAAGVRVTPLQPVSTRYR